MLNSFVWTGKKKTLETLEVCVCQKNKATVIKDNWLLELEN